MAQLAVTFAETDASRPSADADPRLDAAQVDDPEIAWRAAREPAQTGHLLNLLDGEMDRVAPADMAALAAWPLPVRELVTEYYTSHCSAATTRAAAVMFDVDGDLPARPTLQECVTALVAAKVFPVDVPSVASWVARTRAMAKGEPDPGPLPEPVNDPAGGAPPGLPPYAAIAPAPPLPAAREDQAPPSPDRDGAPLPAAAAAPLAPGGAQAGGPPPAPPAPPPAQAASSPVIMTQTQLAQLLAASAGGHSAKSSDLEGADRDTTAHARLMRRLLQYLKSRVYFDPVLLSPAYLEKLLYDPMSSVSKRVVLDTDGQLSLENRGLDAACAALNHSDFRSGCDAIVALLRDPNQPCYDLALADDRQAFFNALWAMHAYPPSIVRNFAKVFMTRFAKTCNWAAEVKSNALMLSTHLITPAQQAEARRQTTLPANRPQLSLRRAGKRSRGPAQPGSFASQRQQQQPRAQQTPIDPANFCYSRLVQKGQCSYDPDCNRDHVCPCCGGDHCASDCLKFDAAVADRADDERRKLNGTTEFKRRAAARAGGARGGGRGRGRGRGRGGRG